MSFSKFAKSLSLFPDIVTLSIMKRLSMNHLRLSYIVMINNSLLLIKYIVNFFYFSCNLHNNRQKTYFRLPDRNFC